MTDRTSRAILWCGIAAYTAYFFAVCWQKFHAFIYFDFDLAVHDLAMWNMLHGSLFNSILDVPYLGNHMHLVMLLLSPVYAVFPSPLTLLFLQTLALSLTAVPLYAATRRIAGNSWAVFLACAYLGFPATGYVNLYEFHPTVFATLFLACAFYFYEVKRFLPFLSFCLLSMLCQENIPFAVVMFGVLALIQRREWKWVLIPFFGGAVYAAAAIKLMAYFNDNTIQYQKIYSHLGSSPLDIAVNAVREPQRFFFSLARPKVLKYLFDTFVPLSFLPLAAPLQMLPALPFFMQHMLSARNSEQTIFYHYSAELLPFVFMSMAYALRRFAAPGCARGRPRMVMAGLAAVAVVTNVYYLGPVVQSGGIFSVSRENAGLIARKYEMLSRIPADAPVVATFGFQPHLTHRKRLYSFHHAYLGKHTLSSKPFAMPRDVQYALIDFNDFLTFVDMYGRDRLPLLRKELLQNGWKVEEVVDSVALFSKREGIPGEFLLRQAEDLSPEQHPAAVLDGACELAQVRAQRIPGTSTVEAFLTWRSLARTQKDIRMYLDIYDREGRLIGHKPHPVGYHLYPTYSWEKGQSFMERLVVLVPSRAAAIKAWFYDYEDGTPCRVLPEQGKPGTVVLWEGQPHAASAL